jgi:Flp pilus assembly protein TadD
VADRLRVRRPIPRLKRDEADGRADADPRVRLNLALVVSLRGRMAAAEAIAKEGRPPEEAAANVTALRKMLTRQVAAKNTSGDSAHAD